MSEDTILKNQTWHPVGFAGWWHLNDEPYYEALNVLSEDDYPGEASKNAQLAGR